MKAIKLAIDRLADDVVRGTEHERAVAEALANDDRAELERLIADSADATRRLEELTATCDDCRRHIANLRAGMALAQEMHGKKEQ